MRHREKDRKNAFLTLLEAKQKVTPACQHVAVGCGGCLLQEYGYEDQLAAKASYLKSVYGHDVKVIAARDPLGYRNRMDFVVAFGMMGLRRRARFAQVVDVTQCMLLPARAREIAKIAHDFLLASDLVPYNFVRHEGFLRYCVVRSSVATGQTMIIITTKPAADDTQAQHVKDILIALHDLTKATSLHWTLNDKLGDMSVGEPFWHLGEACIIDEIAENRFFITPSTFFQGNPVMAGELFDRAMRFVKGDTLDLCCGVGVLSILAAQEEDAGAVVGVEINPASIAAAKENMFLNEVTIDKCEFVCDDMLAFLKKNTRPFHTVICDPARPGLGKETCDALLCLSPERIIYVSCNPVSHNDDIKMLSEKYDVKEMEGYDLFPQTPHIEILSVLELRKNL